MAKPLNMKRRLKALLDAKVPKVRDLNALALILSGKGGGHGDQRKAVAKKCCRGKQDA